MKLIFLDTETTGFDENKNSLYQVGLIYEDFYKTLEFEIKLRPWDNREFNQESLDLVGLKIDDLMTLPHHTDQFQTFKAFLKSVIDPYNPKDKAFLIGYNIAFDEKFLREWFRLNEDDYFGSWFWTPAIDVMDLAGFKLMMDRPNMPNFKLPTVCKHLGIKQTGDIHEAMNDIRMTRELFKLMG